MNPPLYSFWICSGVAYGKLRSPRFLGHIHKDYRGKGIFGNIHGGRDDLTNGDVYHSSLLGTFQRCTYSSHPPSFHFECSHTIIRLWWFHIVLNYLGVIGKKYADSGLENLLVQSEVHGSNTPFQLLEGKSYNHGVRGHNLTLEAVFCLEWEYFDKWLESDQETEAPKGE